LTEEVDAGIRLGDWLLKIDTQLGIRDAVADAGDRSDDQESFEDLVQLTDAGGKLADAKLLEFASDGRMHGKVVVTTFHSSKGRQFDVVVIPGCVEGVLPPWTWNRRRFSYDQPSQRVLRETRRLFYVGFTRARKAVHLACSKGYVHKGHPVGLGVSRFAVEINNRLKSN
jgi:DNA helicase-2/ATP-dependent DNA helicase PcrA